MSSADLVELVHSLQSQLAQRGAGAFRTLQLAFEVNDRDQNGTFDFQEIEAILGKAGLFLKRQHLTKLYRHFDKQQNERVYFPDLLEAIRGELSPRRLNIVNQVFDALDAEGHGAVDIERILKSYDASRHPQVLSGEKRAAEVAREFAVAFDGAGARNNGAVTRAEFIQFYRGIGASIPYDDEYFVTIAQRVWGVKEFIPASLSSAILTGRPGPASATPLLQRVRHVFREKVRQKTVTDKSEVESLRLVFKFFDLTNTGTVDFRGFKQALARFGINLDDATLAALFAEFDTEGSGRIDYLLFTTQLYDEETTSAAHHQFSRSQAFKQSQRLAAEASRPESRQYVDSREVVVSSPGAVAAARSPQGGLASPQAAFGRSAIPRQTLSQKERETSTLPTVVFVLGGPGSGRRTQIARVVREFGFVSLNVADMIASERANPGSALGASLANGGAPAADALVALLAASIRDGVHRGSLYFIVDGFPSTLTERATWDKAMAGKVDVPFALFLEAPQNVLEARLASRAKHTGRGLETPQALQRRFEHFGRETIPLINSFGKEGRLQVVDASAMPDVVYGNVQRIIAEL